MKRNLFIVALLLSLSVTACNSETKQTAVTPAAVEETSTEEFNKAVEKAVAAALETYESKEEVPPTISTETEPATEEGGDNSYFLDFTDKRLVTDSDLTGMTKNQLRVARNEIYARHGYIFNSQELKDYFGDKVWYHPSESFNDSQLSEIEKDNVKRIKSYEENGSVESTPMSLLSGTYTADISDSLMGEYTISRVGSDIYFVYLQSGSQSLASEIEGVVTVLGNGVYAFDYYETDGLEFSYHDKVRMTEKGFTSELTGSDYVYDDYR